MARQMGLLPSQRRERARYDEDEEWDFFDSARGSHRSGAGTGATPTTFDYSGSGRDTGDHSMASSSFMGCETSSVMSFGYEEEFDHKSTEKVRCLFEEIDDTLYRDAPSAKVDGGRSKATADECNLWASTFCHLRMRGVGLVPALEDGVQLIQTAAPIHDGPPPAAPVPLDAASAHAAQHHQHVGVEGLVGVDELDDLSIRGTRAEIRQVSATRSVDGKADATAEDANRFAFLEEEIFAIDGDVEENFAKDESDTDGFLGHSTGNYRRGGFPPLSPNACVRDAVNSQIFDHLWTEMLPLLRPLLTAMINYFVPSETSRQRDPPLQSRNASRGIAPIGSGNFHRSRVGSGGAYGRSGSASSATGTDYGIALVNAMTIRPLALNSRGAAGGGKASSTLDVGGGGSRPGSGGYGAATVRVESAGKQSRPGVVYRYGQTQQQQQQQSQLRDAVALAGGLPIQRTRRPSQPVGGSPGQRGVGPLGNIGVSGAGGGNAGNAGNGGISESILRGTSYHMGPAKSPSPVPSNAGSPTPLVGWGSRPGTSNGSQRRLPPISRDGLPVGAGGNGGNGVIQIASVPSTVSLALTDFVQGIPYGGDGDPHRSGSPPLWRGRASSSATQRVSSARSETAVNSAVYAGRQSPTGPQRRPSSRTQLHERPSGAQQQQPRVGSSGSRSYTPVNRRQTVTPSGVGMGGADEWPLAQGVALVPGLQRRPKPVSTTTVR
eukprot:Opistho-2@35170